MVRLYRSQEHGSDADRRHLQQPADGAIVNVNGNNFQADCQGGDGNDRTLTVVP